MRRALQRIQTAAADRWSFVEHPRLYRVVRPKRDWLDGALTWSLFGWGMLAIWGTAFVGVLIVVVTLIGWASQ